MNTAELTTTSEIEQELMDLIGIEKTIELEQVFKGTYIYIGAKAPSKAIIEAVGMEAALKLVGYFGCGDIWVPRMLLLKDRDNKIVQGKNTGKTVKELAAQFRLGTRRIHIILKERNIHA